MLWQIITCDNSRHIVEAQKYLFKKYVPTAEVRYVDLRDEPISTWSTNVLSKLDTSQEYTILGLDDFLPIDYFKEPKLPEVFDRFELLDSIGKKGKYSKDDPYRVSCQFSIWRTEALVNALKEPKDPWKFEVKGTLDGDVYANEEPWMYIKESAISNRQKGKVNLAGLRKEDIDELVKRGLVEEDKIVYGWKGNHERTKESYGGRYQQYYD